jgi:excisionase family DNA binding protein
LTQQPQKYYSPYTLTVKNASEYFGFAPNTLYHWINDGKLVRGEHYLKIGRKVLIVRDKFIEFMEVQDGCKE